jgi:hypothetical protein
MLLSCSCGSVAWAGTDDTRIERLPDGRVAIDAGDGWRPGERWQCRECLRVVATETPEQATLDETIDRWLEAQRW